MEAYQIETKDSLAYGLSNGKRIVVYTEFALEVSLGIGKHNRRLDNPGSYVKPTYSVFDEGIGLTIKAPS